jgi:transcriptional regulator NrdR family protein
MNCPQCNEGPTRVRETRTLIENTVWVKRRRHCASCDHVFWTVEMPADDVSLETETEND